MVYHTVEFGQGHVAELLRFLKGFVLMFFIPKIRVHFGDNNNIHCIHKHENLVVFYVSSCAVMAQNVMLNVPLHVV